MMLSLLVTALVVVAGITSALFIEERAKPKDVAAGSGISEVAFVRSGVVIQMDQSRDVDRVQVLDVTGTPLKNVSVGQATPRVLVPLEWTRDAKYRFDVHLANGDVLSSPAYAPEKTLAYELFEKSYAKEFPVEEYHASLQAHSHTEAVLQFTRDGGRLGVGALEGRASIIDVSTGKELWVHYIDNLSIESVQFTDDGTHMLVGGHHPDYRFVCLDAATGQELWHKDAKAEVGDTPTHAAPSTYLQVRGNTVWMGLSTSWTEKVVPTRSYMTEPRNASQVLHYRSKIYCFDAASGDRKWTFPTDGDATWDDWGGGVMDRGIMQDSIMLDDAGRYLSISFSSRMGDTKYDEAVLVVFDATAGTIEWRWEMPVLAPAFRSHITNSWMSPDGRWIAVGSMDGRGYLFDNAAAVSSGVGAPKWMRNLGMFETIGGVEGPGLVTHTSDISAYTDGATVMFHVARTQDTTSYTGNSKTNVMQGTFLNVAFDLDGGLMWTFKIGETRAYAGTGRYAYGVGGGFIGFANEHQEYSGLSEDSSTLYYTYYLHPTRTESYYTVMDLKHGSYDGYTHLEWRFRLTGSPGSQGAISPDGRYVAICESPVDMDPTGSNPDYVGEYRVIVLT